MEILNRRLPTSDYEVEPDVNIIKQAIEDFLGEAEQAWERRNNRVARYNALAGDHGGDAGPLGRRMHAYYDWERQYCFQDGNCVWAHRFRQH